MPRGPTHQTLARARRAAGFAPRGLKRTTQGGITPGGIAQGGIAPVHTAIRPCAGPLCASPFCAYAGTQRGMTATTGLGCGLVGPVREIARSVRRLPPTWGTCRPPSTTKLGGRLPRGMPGVCACHAHTTNNEPKSVQHWHADSHTRRTLTFSTTPGVNTTKFSSRKRPSRTPPAPLFLSLFSPLSLPSARRPGRGPAVPLEAAGALSSVKGL